RGRRRTEADDGCACPARRPTVPPSPTAPSCHLSPAAMLPRVPHFLKGRNPLHALLRAASSGNRAGRVDLKTCASGRGEHPRQHTGVHAARPARPSPDGARAPREPELLAALLWRARAVADGWSRMLHFRYARVRKTFPEQRGMSTSVRARLIRVARTLAGSVVGLLVGVTLTLA